MLGVIIWELRWEQWSGITYIDLIDGEEKSNKKYLYMGIVVFIM